MREGSRALKVTLSPIFDSEEDLIPPPVAWFPGLGPHPRLTAVESRQTLYQAAASLLNHIPRDVEHMQMAQARDGRISATLCQ